jgi:6-phosphogluconolactonase (cycloisomerase 2 family)
VGTIAGAATAPTSGHALFVETDSTTGNSVLSYERSADGTIAYVGTFATGGLGAVAANAVADPLASQSGLSLIANGSELVATNPGSNTVTVFSVHGTQLRAIQQISSGGLFPVSIASHGNLVATLNAGGAGSVGEFKLVNDKLVALSGGVRTLGLTNTTPPDFLHGAGQVGFTPNGQHLIVTTKASTSSYEVFSVTSNGSLGVSPVITPADNAVPFAFDFDASGNLVAVEASNSSVSTYSVNADGTLTSLGTVSDGAKALCWISTADGYFFGDNAGSSTISSFDESTAGAPQLVNATAGTAHAGTTDSVVSPDGKTLYVESGGAGTIDAYTIGAGGSLTQLETVFNIPVASEGIAVS